MTLLQWYDLCEYWADNPPTHYLLKMVHKYQRKKEKPTVAQNLESFYKEMTGRVLPS